MSVEKNQPKSLAAYIKPLFLLSPEQAKGVGFKVSEPVFASMMSYKDICVACGKKYGPLAYAHGIQTTAHDIHDKVGGLSCYQRTFQRGHNDYFINEPTSWFAKVKPTSEVIVDDRFDSCTLKVRTRSLIVEEIHAKDWHNSPIKRGKLINFGGRLVPVGLNFSDPAFKEIPFTFDINSAGQIKFTHS